MVNGYWFRHIRLAQAGPNLEVTRALVLHHTAHLGKPLGIGGDAQDVGQCLVAREGNAKLAQTVDRHSPAQTTWTQYLNAVVVHGHLNLGGAPVRRVIAVHKRVGHRLAHGRLGILGSIDAKRPLHLRRDAHVASQRHHQLRYHHGDGPDDLARIEKTQPLGAHIGLRRPRDHRKRKAGPREITLRKAPERHKSRQCGSHDPLPVTSRHAERLKQLLVAHTLERSRRIGTLSAHEALQKLFVKVAHRSPFDHFAIVVRRPTPLQQAVHLVGAQPPITIPHTRIGAVMHCARLDEAGLKLGRQLGHRGHHHGRPFEFNDLH